MSKTIIIVLGTVLISSALIGTVGALSIHELKEHCLSKNGVMIRTETHGYKCFDSKLLKTL